MISSAPSRAYVDDALAVPQIAAFTKLFNVVDAWDDFEDEHADLWEGWWRPENDAHRQGLRREYQRELGRIRSRAAEERFEEWVQAQRPERDEEPECPREEKVRRWLGAVR